jgi:endonuclease IV
MNRLENLLGIHLHKNGDIDLSKSVKDMPWHSVQIFTHGPMNFKLNNFNLIDLKDNVKDKQINLFVHSTHLSKPFKQSKSIINHIKEQMDISKQINALGLIVHLPKAEPIIIVDTYKLFMDNSVKIIFETPALKPDNKKDANSSTYCSPENLNYLFDKLIEAKCINFGLCIDTAHLFSSGINITNKCDAEKWLADFKHHKYIKLFHLNGNMTDLGSGKDKHAIPLSIDDKIWNKFNSTNIKDSGLIVFIKFAIKLNIPMIMEINRGADDDLKKSIKMISDAINQPLPQSFYPINYII